VARYAGPPGSDSPFSESEGHLISDHHRVPLPMANWLGTVYHGMPPATLEPSYARGIYLAFLWRLTRENGPEAAIHIARAIGMPLRMAAKIPRSKTRYYKERLQPMIDGEQIKLVGELNDKAKGDLLRGAGALWPEPFGLDMIEAMDGLRGAGDRVPTWVRSLGDRRGADRLHCRRRRSSHRGRQAHWRPPSPTRPREL
jgi:hypothetical protein